MITNYRIAPSIGYANGSTKINKSTQVQIIEDFSEKREPKDTKIKRQEVINAINRKDRNKCRIFSQKMYSKNPVYFRLVEYFANILCFYWVSYPSYFLNFDKSEEEIQNDWMKTIIYLEKINPEVLGKRILSKCIINGEIYFVVKERITSKTAKAFGIQELPIEACRAIKKINNRDIVEINLDFFDSISKSELSLIEKSYPDFLVKLIKNRNLCPKDPATGKRWAVIDPNYAFHFSLKKDNLPFFIGTILDLLDLQDAKDINMFKMEQELSKILALIFPLGDDGVPVFDDDEITVYHNEIANLLGQVPGLEIISTMAEVKDIDLSGSSQTQNVDNVDRQYQNVFNSAGVSQKLMSADNAGTLSTSITVDSSILFNFLDKFNDFLNIQVSKVFGDNNYIVHMPPVTYFNQKEKADYYAKQITYGYSKFLPAICMGQRQSFILSSVWFDSQILKMQNIMIPNAASSQTSGTDITNQDDNVRNTKSAEERSEKTEKNRESLEGE